MAGQPQRPVPVAGAHHRVTNRIDGHAALKKRQFKFYIDKGSNYVWIYKPSTTGVTTSNNITVTVN